MQRLGVSWISSLSQSLTDKREEGAVNLPSLSGLVRGEEKGRGVGSL